jgi:hypothetical protein
MVKSYPFIYMLLKLCRPKGPARLNWLDIFMKLFIKFFSCGVVNLRSNLLTLDVIL